MDPLSIAAVITASVLPRALPYLLKLGGALGDSFTEEAGKKFGPEAWESAKSIWSRLGEKLLKKPAGKEAVDDVVKDPEDPDTVASFRKEVKKLLEEDPVLAGDLEKIVKNRITVDMALGEIVESTVTGVRMKGAVTGAQVNLVAKDVRKSTITGIDMEKIG